MNTTLRRAAATFIGVSMLAPVFASADTISDLQNQIKSLLQQLQAAQMQMRAAVSASSTMPMPEKPDMNASSTMPMPKGCLMIERELKQGSSGEDVKQLQQFLAQDSSVFPEGAVTGTFGPLTAKAMVRFQIKNNIASSTGGTVGPKTREFFKIRCAGMNDNQRTGDMMGSSTMPRMNASTTMPLPPRPIEMHLMGTSSAYVNDGGMPKPPLMGSTTPQGPGKPMRPLMEYHMIVPGGQQ